MKKNILLLCMAIFSITLLAVPNAFAQYDDGHHDIADQLFRAYGRFNDHHADFPYISTSFMANPYLNPAMTPMIDGHLFKIGLEGGFFLPGDVGDAYVGHGTADLNIFAAISLMGFGLGVEIFVNNEVVDIENDDPLLPVDETFHFLNAGVKIPFGLSILDIIGIGFHFGFNYMDDTQQADETVKDEGIISIEGGMDFLVTIMDFIFVEGSLFIYGYQDLQMDELYDVLAIKVPLTAGVNLMDFLTITFQYTFYDFELTGSTREAQGDNNDLAFDAHKLSAGIEVWIYNFAPRFAINYYRLEDTFVGLPFGSNPNEQNQVTLDFGFVMDLDFTTIDFKMIIIPRTTINEDFAMKLGVGFEF